MKTKEQIITELVDTMSGHIDLLMFTLSAVSEGLLGPDDIKRLMPSLQQGQEENRKACSAVKMVCDL